MDDNLKEVSKAKDTFEITVVDGIEEMSNKELSRQDITSQVNQELSSLNEEDLYNSSLNMLRENPEATKDDLIYSMAQSIYKNTDKSFLKKASKKIMKNTGGR